MRAIRFAVLLVTSSLLVEITLPSSQAVPPGLPLLESFDSTDLRDTTRTTANWSTEEESLLLAFRHSRFGAFDPDITSGTDITADAGATVAVAVGDLNGDGRVDFIAGNSGQPNRLYLNNGTASPFEGVIGQDITADAFNTRSLAVGDVDGDGDFDLVVGFNAESPRLYLNNGSSTEPFEGASGIILIAESFNTNGLAIEDMDGDGDLDLILGNTSDKKLLLLNNGTSAPFTGVVPQNISEDETSITSVAVGDVNGDGLPDIVVGSFNQPNRLYLNNGTAAPFEGVAGADITSDTDSTRAIVLGDVDGDGDLDFVAGNDGQPNRLYLNNGTATPFDGVSGVDISATVFQTFGVSLGDVEGDGDLDLVATTSNNRNRLFLNNGSPSPFEGANALSLTTDSAPRRGGVLADFDGDGDLDYAVGVLNAPNRLYLNRGNANPWNGVVGSDMISDGSRTQEVAIGDMDGDGDLDLVVGNGGLATRPNRLYLNNGTSDPFDGVTGSDITADDQSTRAIAVGDVDGDGDLDVVAGNTGVNSRNRLYLNNGTSDPFGGVTGSDITTDEHTTRAVALGDMDGDGDLDFIAGNANTPPRFYRNNGGANPFMGAVGTDITTDIQGADNIALGDMDRDGDLDLVYGRFSNTTRLVLNNGTSDPFAGVIGSDVTDDTAFTQDLKLGDMDGDGDLDILLGVEGQPPRLYLNNGTPNPFEGESSFLIGIGNPETRSIALGDVDEDGDLDLVVGNTGEPNQLYLNNGTSRPFNGVEGLDITADMNDTNSVALADMDGDGALDFVVGIFGGPSRLYLNSTLPIPSVGWSGQELSADSTSAVSVAAGDVNGDGAPDLVMVIGNQRLRLFLNNGSSSPFDGVVGTEISSDNRIFTAVALGDLDRDGDLDLVAGVGSGSIVADHRNRLYLNNGTSDPFAGVAGQNITSDTHVTHAVALGDMDRDGDLDLVVGNGPADFSSAVNRLYLNNGTSDPFAGVAGSDITSDTDDSFSIALGDMDGDSDLDLVAGTFNGRNRLYLNNGTASPFEGVTGSDITTDTGVHRSVALGDLDRDGDLDVVFGRGGRERFYLNNGTSDPFAGVTRTDLSTDSDNTSSVAVGDVNGDGRLDIVKGNFLGPKNLLHLNNGTSDPFAGVAGVALSSATPNASAIALADFNGDGCVDMVFGNSDSPSQFLARRLFNTTSARGVSVVVDDEASDISEIVLEVTETLPINTHIDYWVSNNGGLQSFLVTPGELFTFPTTGSDLRWRAELKSHSPFLSPRLETLFLNQGRNITVDPLSVDFMDHSIAAGPTQSVTITITNNGGADLTFSGFGLFGTDFSEFLIAEVPLESTLVAGASTTARIAFDPASPGAKSAVFQIGSDDPDEPLIQVALTGNGVEGPTETPTETPTSTETPTETPVISDTPTETATPIDGAAEFDIHPDPPDGDVDQGDLIAWLERIRKEGDPSDLLFEFSHFWLSGRD